MKIVKLIALLLATPLLILVFLMVQNPTADYAIYISILFVGLVILYMFSPQVEWWWAQRYPPKPSPNMIKFLNEHFDFFRQLNGADKDKFLLRLNYFIMAKEFTPKVGKTVPVPLQTMISAEGVRTTFGLEDYLIDSHERIVIYPHPFPSPTYQKLHHSETFHEDGVLIFASSPVINQFKGIGNIFNITLYEWISAFAKKENVSFPSFDDNDWKILGLVFMTPKALVQASIGLPNFDEGIVGAVLYLEQKELFKEKFPEKAEQYHRIFRQ